MQPSPREQPAIPPLKSTPIANLEQGPPPPTQQQPAQQQPTQQQQPAQQSQSQSQQQQAQQQANEREEENLKMQQLQQQMQASELSNGVGAHAMNDWFASDYLRQAFIVFVLFMVVSLTPVGAYVGKYIQLSRVPYGELVVKATLCAMLTCVFSALARAYM
jgi:flagellar motor protein MotB